MENSQGLESWTTWRDQVGWMGEFARVTNAYGILANLVNVILRSRSHLPGINYCSLLKFRLLITIQSCSGWCQILAVVAVFGVVG